ncbi:OB-fold domain-containing protein [soil metagenome]
MSDPAHRTGPPVNAVDEPFWAATREQRLVLQWCTACERVVHYPREACPSCLGDDLAWRPASGRGVVHAASTMAATTDRDPYVVALVDLAEGARFMTNVVGCDPADVVIGMMVTVAWEPLDDGRHLPLFAPAAGRR